MTFNSDLFAGGVASSGNWYQSLAAPASPRRMDSSIAILIWGGPSDVWPPGNPIANYDPGDQARRSLLRRAIRRGDGLLHRIARPHLADGDDAVARRDPALVPQGLGSRRVLAHRTAGGVQLRRRGIHGSLTRNRRGSARAVDVWRAMVRARPYPTSTSSVGSKASELVTRQERSAFSRTRLARSGSPPGGILRRARRARPVKRVLPSTRSMTPSALQSRASHASFEACATARNVRMRQSTDAATNSVSGDH